MTPALIILVTVCYLGVAVSEYIKRIVFVGYSIANVGLIVGVQHAN
jgi:hypothetical protein